MAAKITNTIRERFWANVQRSDGCWRWTGDVCPRGYGRFAAHDATHAAHRISYRIHKAEIPAGLLVCHTCDNRLCVNPDHLWLGTHKDNAIDRARKGRNPRGSFGLPGHSNPRVKLSCEDVRQIRALKGKLLQREIGTKFGVTQQQVSMIHRGKQWSSTV